MKLFLHLRRPRTGTTRHPGAATGHADAVGRLLDLLALHASDVGRIHHCGDGRRGHRCNRARGRRGMAPSSQLSFGSSQRPTVNTLASDLAFQI